MVGHLAGNELEAALQRLMSSLPECQQVALQLCLPAGGSRTMTMGHLQKSFLKSVRTLLSNAPMTDSSGKVQQQEAELSGGLARILTSRIGNGSMVGGVSLKQRVAAASEKVRHLTLTLVGDDSGAAWQLPPCTLKLLLALAPQLQSLELQLQCPEALQQEGVQQLQQLLAASSQLLRLKLSFFSEAAVAQLLQPLACAEGRLVCLELFAASWVCPGSLAAAAGQCLADGLTEAAGDVQPSSGDAVRLISQLGQLQLLLVNPGGPELEAQWPGWRPALVQVMGGQRVLFEHMGWHGGQEAARHSLEHWRGW